MTCFHYILLFPYKVMFFFVDQIDLFLGYFELFLERYFDSLHCVLSGGTQRRALPRRQSDV